MKVQNTDQKVLKEPTGELVYTVKDTGLEIWAMDDGTLILRGDAEALSLAELQLRNIMPEVPITKVLPN